MGALQQFERRLEGAVEGFFARAFRSGIQPVELAKAIQRYAADSQHVTSDGVVIPNVYRVTVGPKDRDRLAGFGASLPRELAEIVVNTAVERGWLLRGPAKVRIIVDDKVRVGRYRVAGRVEVADELSPAARTRARTRARTGDSGFSSSSPPGSPGGPTPPGAAGLAGGAASVGPAGAAAAGAALGATAAARPATASPATASPTPEADGSDDARPAIDRTQVISAVPTATAELVVRSGTAAGARAALRGMRVTVGRLDSCDLTIDDSTVSREHAAFVRRGDAWWVVDLGSTNGTSVNGTRAAEHPVAPGDRVELGDVVVELVGA